MVSVFTDSVFWHFLNKLGNHQISGFPDCVSGEDCGLLIRGEHMFKFS